jgi:hypothetical protein
MSISAQQRYTKDFLCPICCGGKDMPQGRGQRCYGYESDDREYACCTREEHAGSLDLNQRDQSYHHRLQGECRCGRTHGAASGKNYSGRPARPHSAKPVRTEKPAARRTSSKQFVIVDEPGNRIVHVRSEYDDGSKRFAWIRNGEATLGGLSVESLPLYGAADALTLPIGSTLVITEGETACDALRAVGIPAVATITGAHACPSPDSLRPFIGYDLVLYRDNDQAGLGHMADVAQTFWDLGRRPRWLEIPDAQEKDDAVDFLKRDTPERLQELIAGAPFWEPCAQPSPALNVVDLMDELDRLREFIQARSAAMQNKELTYADRVITDILVMESFWVKDAPIRNSRPDSRLYTATIAAKAGCNTTSVTATLKKVTEDMDTYVGEDPPDAPLLKSRELLFPGQVDPVSGEILTEPRSFNHIVPNYPTAAEVYRRIATWKPPAGLERRIGERRKRTCSTHDGVNLVSRTIVQCPVDGQVYNDSHPELPTPEFPVVGTATTETLSDGGGRIHVPIDMKIPGWAATQHLSIIDRYAIEQASKSESERSSVCRNPNCRYDFGLDPDGYHPECRLVGAAS